MHSTITTRTTLLHNLKSREYKFNSKSCYWPEILIILVCMFDVELGWSVTRGQNTSLNLIISLLSTKSYLQWFESKWKCFHSFGTVSNESSIGPTITYMLSGWQRWRQQNIRQRKSEKYFMLWPTGWARCKN